MSKLVLLTKAEAARFLGWSRQKFHYYVSIGRVPGLRIIGSKQFYNKEKIAGWKPKDKRSKTK